MNVYECVGDPSVFEVLAATEGSRCYQPSMPPLFFNCNNVVVAWTAGSEVHKRPLIFGHLIIDYFFKFKSKPTVSIDSITVPVSSERRCSEIHVCRFGFFNRFICCCFVFVLFSLFYLSFLLCPCHTHKSTTKRVSRSHPRPAIQ